MATRILVLEDNEDFRALLQAKLELEGFHVSAAPNGARALDAMARHPAEVLVTDLFMPEKDGLETILAIRARYPAVVILAMSGWTSPTDSDYLKVAREIGAAHTFRKPFDLDEMVRLIREHTRRH